MAGLYIHIPYCRTKCSYCDFYSTPNTSQLLSIVDALCAEWEMRKNEINEPIETIYFGGGTPSILPPELFMKLVSALPVSSKIKEFTIEANPDDITPELVSIWKQCGIGRVSMGIQSFDNEQLKAINRRHTAEGAIHAVNVLRKLGIDNFSLDLIYGLPNQTIESWEMSLNKLLEIRPSHFSAYILSYEPGTRLYAQLITGKIKEADDELIEKMYTYLCHAAKNAGYDHYEISNFALPGKKAVHNSSYWKFSPYIGLGPSAHSFDGNIRRINPSNIKKYIAAIESGKVAAEIEVESDLDRLNDMIMVGLRTSDGLALNMIDQKEKDGLMQRTKLLPPSHVIIENNRMFIPEDKLLVSDAIIRTLLA